MEKLLELLNEYGKQKEGVYRIEYKTENLTKREKALFCSKYWGWIKWLVDNDKIDFENRDLKDKYMEYFERYPYYPYSDFSLEGLIMLLSISEQPIELLCSILK